MTLHPDEQARELAREAMRKRGEAIANLGLDSVVTDIESTEQWLASLLIEARLAEAEWWHTRVAMAYMCDEQEMRTETRARIDELKRQAAGEGTK